MRCPYCKKESDKVVDSRPSEDGNVIRRRRQCLKCNRRYTSYERVEQAALRVVKKDGTREDFDREKIRRGMVRACEKRPVSSEKIDKVIEEIESEAIEKFEREVPTKFIGEKVMEGLRGLDQVAYVRFASVYKEFQDIHGFRKIMEEFVKGDRDGTG